MGKANQMTGGVFISYRRQDSLAEARALFERLRTEFGGDQVFIDLHSLQIGVDFVHTLKNCLDRCQVLIALIGPDWLGVETDPPGTPPRIWQDGDFIRMEVRSALERGIQIIPVLVHGASLPTADQIPAELVPLLRRHATRLRMAEFDHDVRPLIEAITLPQAPASPTQRHRTLPKWIVGGGVAACGVALITYFTLANPNSNATPQDCSSTASRNGFFDKCSAPKRYDDGSMLRVWPTPLSWKPGQAPMRIGVTLSHYEFDDYKKIEIPASGVIPATAARHQRGIDDEARDILQKHIDLAPAAQYYAKIGLKGTLPIPEAADDSFTYLNVIYLPEWEREIFNWELAVDHYTHAGSRYQEQRNKWYSKPEIEFPSFLFSEFLVITNDPEGGLAVIVRKGSKSAGAKRQSMLAKIWGDDISSATSETGIQVGPGRDLEQDATTQRLSININTTVARGLRELGFTGLEDAAVNLIVNHGVAFQEGTMNSALLSLVWVDKSCAEIRAIAQKKNATAIECMRPQAAQIQLGLTQSSFRWHPTARLRLAYWIETLQLQQHLAPKPLAALPGTAR